MASRARTGMWRWRGARMILAAALFCALVALAISYTVRREYQANVRISVVPARLDLGTTDVLHDLLRNYAVQIVSADFARRAGVRAAAEPDKLLIQVAAVHRDPQVAAQAAQTAARQFVEERAAYNTSREQQDRIEVSLLDPAPQITTSYPRLWTDVLGAGLLSAAGTALILVLRHRLRAEG